MTMAPTPQAKTSKAATLRDDRAVAGVVGFVLILAAAVTYYSFAAQNEVPRTGAMNERAWDAKAGAIASELARSAGQNAGTFASVHEAFPPAPEAPTQLVPFLSPLHSSRATGTMSFNPLCGGATLTHESAGAVVMDLVDSAKGCFTFEGRTSYAEAFAYRIEHGGILRIQSDQTAVLGGPPMDITTVDGVTRISLTLLDLRGPAQSVGVDRTNVVVNLVPRPGSLEVASSTNAENATWSLTTSYPEAWNAWFVARLAEGGAAATTSFTCPGVGSGPQRGDCQLQVNLAGPATLSVSYGRYDVTLG